MLEAQGTGNLSNSVHWDWENASVSSIQAASVDRVTGNRQVRPSVPEDGPAIIELMRQAGLDPHVEPEHLHWKYWRERPDWPGSRSFVLTSGTDLLAHGAVVPGSIRWGANRARVIHMIDWAARREALGAGVILMKHVGGLTDFLLGIGGSQDTLSIMPRIGYQPWGTVTGYVRTLAPLGILRRPVRPGWKRWPRIARSALWRLAAPRSDLRGWRVRQLEPQELDSVGAVLPADRPGLTVFGRTVDALRHALACPIVPVELFVLERNGRAGGYFLLSYAPGQARLVDAWVVSDDPADWRALAHAAVQQAQCRGGAAELAVWASDGAFAQILRESGFHTRLSLPIYLRPSVGESVPSMTPRVHMLDNDAYYLHFGGNELWA